MVHAKNYETVSTFVKVMQKKPWPDTVYFRFSVCFNIKEKSSKSNCFILLYKCSVSLSSKSSPCATFQMHK